MWYRIEIGDDDEILACVEVEDAARGTRRIFYVEAENTERAVVAAKRWARMRAKDTLRQRERRAEQRASNRCQHGRCQYAPESGKKYCPQHLREMRERIHAYNNGVRLRPARTDAEKYEHRIENDKPLTRKLRTLEEVLAAYRTEPNFEVWLTRKIREIQCQLNKELVDGVVRKSA